MLFYCTPPPPPLIISVVIVVVIIIISVVVLELLIPLLWSDIILNRAVQVYVFIFLMLDVMTQGECCSVKKIVIFCSNGEMCFYHILKRTSVVIIMLLTY